MADQMLNTERTAEHIGVSPKTIRRWRYEGTGPPAHKVGAAVRYRRSDIDAWLAARRSA